MQQEISDTLVDLITGLVDGDDNPYFGQVVDYEPGADKFDATPFGVLLPRDQPGEYSTTAQNDRHEEFNFYICQPLETYGITFNSEGEEIADDATGSRQQLWKDQRILGDAVRNAIDATQDLDGLIGDGGKSRVMAVKPTSAGWQMADTGNGETLITEIKIDVRYSYDFR